MELAKLFATVGFKVDMDGLTAFRKELATVKTEVTGTAVAVGNLKNQLRGMTASFKSLNRSIDTDRVSNWRKNVNAAASDFYKLHMANATSLQRSSDWIDNFIRNMVRLDGAINGRAVKVREYADAIGHLAQNFFMLKQATAGIGRFRQVPSSMLSQAQGGTMRQPSQRGGGGSGGGGGDANQYIGYWGRASGFAKSGPAAFLRPMLPTGMGLFNAVAAGYGFKELVNTGREMMQLELMLKTVSGGLDDFNSNLEFTRKVSNDLGIDVQNLTESYAKFYLAGKPLFTRDTLQEAFKGTQSYFRLLGMTPEKIKLANKAIEQMMNKQRVNAEELKGQLAEHATGALQAFANAASGGDVQKLFAMMEKGQVGVDTIVGGMREMGKIAANSPELAKMLAMSTAEQGRFNNKMKELSRIVMESGLDEMLAKMFRGMADGLEYVNPLIKDFVGSVKWLTDKAGIALGYLWDIKGLLLTGLGFSAVIWYVLRTGFVFATFTGIIKNTLLALLSLKATAAGLLAVFTGFLYVMKSIDDYLGGEDNWLHGVQLGLMWLMTEVENVGLAFQIMFEGVKYGWNSLASIMTSNPTVQTIMKYNPLSLSGRLLGETIGRISEWADKQEGAGDLYKNPYGQPIRQPKQSQPMIQPTINISLDMSKVPGGMTGDWSKVGETLGNSIVNTIRNPSAAGLGVRN